MHCLSACVTLNLVDEPKNDLFYGFSVSKVCKFDYRESFKVVTLTDHTNKRNTRLTSCAVIPNGITKEDHLAIRVGLSD